MDKTKCKKEACLLQPLPIQERLWLSVSMNFISRFKVDGNASIMVVVDMFSKYSVFIIAPELCSSKILVDFSISMWLNTLVLRLTL